jgi:hypothetical protein
MAKPRSKAEWNKFILLFLILGSSRYFARNCIYGIIIIPDSFWISTDINSRILESILRDW